MERPAGPEQPQPPVNVIVTATGKHRPVCEYCGRVGRAATPSHDGRLGLFDVATGWSCAPYPADFVHPDGSTGDRWGCPSCKRRLRRGETLWSRRRVGAETDADGWCESRDPDLSEDPRHIHDWVLDRSDYEPCVCGAVMPEAPF